MIRFPVIVGLLAATPALAAGPFQDTAGLDRAVGAFTGVPIGQTGGARSAIDARLKLAACPTVTLAWRGAGHDAVVVQCTGPDWRIFVPVLAAPSAPAAAPAAFVRPAPAAPPVIRRGDPVTIAATQGGFTVTRDGIAMGDAAPGGRIAIRMDDASAPVVAVALQPGQATLPGFSE